MNRHGISVVLLGVLGRETAHAAAGPVEEVLGIGFWVFIGYCSIIVIPQAFRACRFLLSTGTKPAKKEAEAS
jgi:hypothetical protein